MLAACASQMFQGLVFVSVVSDVRMTRLECAEKQRQDHTRNSHEKGRYVLHNGEAGLARLGR